MKATKVTVSAGRTFNHPYEQYSNLRSEAVVEVEIEEGEDPAAAVKTLQAQVEGLVEDHKQAMLRSLEQLETMRRAEAEMRGLQSELKRAQDRLDAVRREHPQLSLLPSADAEAPEHDEVPCV